jgi:hypothetical protein
MLEGASDHDRAEMELRHAWGPEAFEANVAVLQDWTASIDGRLGGSGREFSATLEASGLASDVGFAKAALAALKSDGTFRVSPAEARRLIDRIRTVPSTKNEQLREIITESLAGLYQIAFPEGRADA